MNINAINNNQPSFGMAWKVTYQANKMLTDAVKKPNELINIKALQDMFSGSKDTLSIRSALECSRPQSSFTKKLMNLLLGNKLNVEYTRSGIGRTGQAKARRIVATSNLVKNPKKYLNKLGGGYLQMAFDESKRAVFRESLVDSLINTIPE
jgi:hypothetical protein